MRGSTAVGHIENGRATGFDDGIEVVGGHELLVINSDQMQAPNVDAAALTQVEDVPDASEGRAVG